MYLHRRMAIQEWVKVMAGFEVPLERALGAFDMFVLRERDLDFDNVHWVKSNNRGGNVLMRHRYPLNSTILRDRFQSRFQTFTNAVQGEK